MDKSLTRGDDPREDTHCDSDPGVANGQHRQDEAEADGHDQESGREGLLFSAAMRINWNRKSALL